MTPPGDHVDDMSNDTMTDEAMEAFFLGLPHPSWEREEALATLASDVTVALTGSPPAPSHALLQLFWSSGVATEPVRAAVPERRSFVPAAVPPDGRAGARPTGGRRRLLGSLALGLGVAVLGVGTAGATGALPDPVQRVVARVVEAVSPFEVPEPDGRHSTGPPADGGAGMVEGTGGPTTVTKDAATVPPAGGPSGLPQQTGPVPLPNLTPPQGPGATGVDRARQTPAGESIPPAVPAPAPGPATEGRDGTGGAPPSAGLGRAGQTPAGPVVPSSVPARRP